MISEVLETAPRTRPLELASEMAGAVRSHAIYSAAQDGVVVEPHNCPVADAHRKRAEEEYRREHGKDSELPYQPGLHYLHCTTLAPDGTRRWCPYYYGLASYGNVTQRVDLSTIREQSIEHGRGGINVYTLCVGAPRNRPPGC